MGASDREIYHTLQPHPALSPVPLDSDPSTIRSQTVNEAAWRQLLFGSILSHLLPPEDLENPCLRVLVNEIFAEMILGNGVSGKACEGWLIWDGITKVLTAIREKAPEVVEKIESPAANRLEQFGLLPTRDDKVLSEGPSRSPIGITQSISVLLWELLRIGFLIFVSLRTAVTVFTDSDSLPPRSTEDNLLSPITPSPTEDGYASSGTTPSQSAKGYPKRSILEMSAWTVPKQFLRMEDRMPWLSSILSLSQHYLIHGPGKLCSTDGRIDR